MYLCLKKDTLVILSEAKRNEESLASGPMMFCGVNEIFETKRFLIRSSHTEGGHLRIL